MIHKYNKPKDKTIKDNDDDGENKRSKEQKQAEKGKGTRKTKVEVRASPSRQDAAGEPHGGSAGREGPLPLELVCISELQKAQYLYEQGGRDKFKIPTPLK